MADQIFLWWREQKKQKTVNLLLKAALLKNKQNLRKIKYTKCLKLNNATTPFWTKS